MRHIGLLNLRWVSGSLSDICFIRNINISLLLMICGLSKVTYIFAFFELVVYHKKLMDRNSDDGRCNYIIIIIIPDGKASHWVEFVYR